MMRISSSVIIFVVTFTADSALDSLSSMTSSTGYFFLPTAIPPAALTSSSHSWAANFVPSPTLGMSPVSGALIPIRIVGSFAQPVENANAAARTQMHNTNHFLIADSPFFFR